MTLLRENHPSALPGSFFGGSMKYLYFWLRFVRHAPQGMPNTEAAIVTGPMCVLLSLLVVSLFGCGSSNQMANQNSTSSGSKAENWQFLLTPASSDVPLANDIEAVLILTPDKFVGTARIIGAAYPNSDPCYNIDDPIPLSGTIDAQGNVSVTSAAVRGQVLSLTGLLAPDRSSVSLGTYAFKGGCGDGQTGLLTGVKFKPIGGIYNGTLTETGASVAVSADLTQSTTRDGSGFLEVKGTVNYTGACTEKFTVSSSELAGRFIQLQLGAEDGSNTSVYGNVDANGSKLQLIDYEGGCNGFNGGGVLSPE
jgi:hypothetical protein